MRFYRHICENRLSILHNERVHIIKVISSYFKVSEKIRVMNCRRGVTAECNSKRESAEQNETKEIDGWVNKNKRIEYRVKENDVFA